MAREKKRWSDSENFVIKAIIGKKLEESEEYIENISKVLNRGVGGDLDGSGFGGALGYYRPSGTFSFINGLTLFYGLTSSFVFYFLSQPKEISKSILIISLLVAIFSIPFTISRTILFQNTLCFLFYLFIIFKKPKQFYTLLFILLLLRFVFCICNDIVILLLFN